MRRSRKFKKGLPEDFQEVLMTTEMEVQNEITVTGVRKLVYLYTRGMEYYDLCGKEKFRVFYSDKLVNLLSRKDIIEFLEKNKIDINNKEDLDKLFANPKDQELDIDSKEFTKLIRRNSIKLVKPDINLLDINFLVKQKILEVSTNLNKIDKEMTNEIIDQMAEFEENKRNMEVRESPYIINKDKNEEKKEEENNNNEIKNEEDELKIIENIEKINIDKNNNDKGLALRKLSGSTDSIGNNPMLNEIEEFVQKNMEEMYQQLKELKESFESEIKEAEENGLNDIADGLREDLESELENLKDQYEEQRRVETEKIKEKYSLRNSIPMGGLKPGNK